MTSLRTATILSAAVAAIGLAGLASPAQADWHHRWHRGWHPHPYWYHPWAPPVVVAPRPYYYAPPVVYAPPPVVYAPQPAYYAPGVSVGLSLR